MLSYRTTNINSESSIKHAVLLLHAFPLSAEMWVPQLEALGTAGYAVIAPNSFGIEGSPEKEGWSFTDYAHEMATLLDALKIEKVTVAGLSMGGYQAFEFYRLYPEKTSSLVLCDTRAEGDAPAARATREDFIQAVEKNGAEEAAMRMIPNYFAANTYTERPELVAQASGIITKQSANVINQAMRAIMMRHDATPRLAAITCPVTVINGAEDRLTTRETAESIHAHIPGSRITILANAGHISNLEQPDTFNLALLEHLAEVRV